MRSLEIVLALGTLLTACSPATTVPPSKPNIVVEGLSVPTIGPLSSAVMTDTAERLLEAQGQIDKLSTSESGVRRYVAEIARELRAESAGKLDLALRVARRTSSGLDASIVGEAAAHANALEELLSTPPPPTLHVLTELTVAPTDFRLHFMTMAGYREGRKDWESYSFGVPLHIGRYIFRVTPCSNKDARYLEQILVIAQPTRRVIQHDCLE